VVVSPQPVSSLPQNTPQFKKVFPEIDDNPGKLSHIKLEVTTNDYPRAQTRMEIGEGVWPLSPLSFPHKNCRIANLVLDLV